MHQFLTLALGETRPDKEGSVPDPPIFEERLPLQLGLGLGLDLDPDPYPGCREGERKEVMVEEDYNSEVSSKHASFLLEGQAKGQGQGYDPDIHFPRLVILSKKVHNKT